MSSIIDGTELFGNFPAVYSQSYPQAVPEGVVWCFKACCGLILLPHAAKKLARMQ